MAKLYQTLMQEAGTNRIAYPKSNPVPGYRRTHTPISAVKRKAAKKAARKNTREYIEQEDI